MIMENDYVFEEFGIEVELYFLYYYNGIEIMIWYF